jgi:sporulation related protein
VRPSLLIGLVLAAGPALAAPSGPIVKDGVEISILPGAGPAGPGGIVEVTLDVEARSDAAAAKLKFRSMRGVTAIDCRVGANRFIKAEAFPEANLRGDVSPKVVSGEWVQPAAESYMLAVTARVCGAAPAARPMTTAASGPLPIVRMGTGAAAPAPASPAPTSSPPATPPARIAMAMAPKPALAAPPPRAFRAKADGRGVAQVAASATAQGAQHVLDQLHALITPPLAASVEAATVKNAAVFRASVAGFVSLGDAQAFCARAASVSKTCWVHWKAAAPAPAAPHHA